MDMGLEAIVIPVSNADRSKEFYSNLGWRLDADIKKDGDYRVIQFTPPGSACSVIFGVGISKAEPGSYKDLILVVDDVEKAQSELASHGVEVSEILHGGIFGSAGKMPGMVPCRESYDSLVSFSDPDGNGWLVQEITDRLPGR